MRLDPDMRFDALLGISGRTRTPRPGGMDPLMFMPRLEKDSPCWRTIRGQVMNTLKDPATTNQELAALILLDVADASIIPDLEALIESKTDPEFKAQIEVIIGDIRRQSAEKTDP